VTQSLADEFLVLGPVEPQIGATWMRERDHPPLVSTVDLANDRSELHPTQEAPHGKRTNRDDNAWLDKG
jgi:hypothetical protein